MQLSFSFIAEIKQTRGGKKARAHQLTRELAMIKPANVEECYHQLLPGKEGLIFPHQRLPKDGALAASRGALEGFPISPLARAPCTPQPQPTGFPPSQAQRQHL